MKITDFFDSAVVLLIDGVGDMLMTVPALRALTHFFPNKITLICVEGINLWFLSDLPFNKIISIKVNYLTKSTPLFSIEHITKEIAETKVFFSFCTWHSDLIFEAAKILKATTTIGFFREYNVDIKRCMQRHSIDDYFEFPRIFFPNLSILDYYDRLPISSHAVETTRKFKQKVLKAINIIVIHPETKPEKMWDPKKFNHVINTFLDLNPTYTALVIGNYDHGLAYGKYKKRIISCFGFSFIMACALVSQANLFLGVDSCMLHVADFFRIPCVGLFGPTDSQKYGVRFSRHIHVISKGHMDNIICDDCSQCNTVITLRSKYENCRNST